MSSPSLLPGCLLFFRALKMLWENTQGQYLWLKETTNGRMRFRGAVLVRHEDATVAYALGLPINTSDTFSAGIAYIPIPPGIGNIPEYVKAYLASSPNAFMLYTTDPNLFFFPETDAGMLAWHHAPTDIANFNFDLRSRSEQRDAAIGYEPTLVESLFGFLQTVRPAL